jgi:hypothetical protein
MRLWSDPRLRSHKTATVTAPALPIAYSGATALLAETQIILKGDFMRDNNSEHRHTEMSQTTQADALVGSAAFGKDNTCLIHIHDESLKIA